MKITFQIDYHTAWGEAMHIIGSLPCLSGGLEMTIGPEGNPTATVEISPAQASFSYRYELRRSDGTVRREWGKDRTLCVDPHVTSLLVSDKWQDLPTDKPFYSAAFTKALFAHNGSERDDVAPFTIELRVDAPTVGPDAVVAVTGSCEQLGDWDPAKALIMECDNAPLWHASLRTDSLPDETEFKFVLLARHSHKLLAWEEGANRRLNSRMADGYMSAVVSGLFLDNPLAAWKGSGTAIPVFSLRSDDGFGVGEFPDLKKMVDWCVATDQQFLQILPINDTTMTRRWTDSYPYTTNSTFALHPMYLRLQDVGEFGDEEMTAEFERMRKELNELPALDYERVNNNKERFLRRIFSVHGKEQMATDEFGEFCRLNDEWLLPYAAWCVLRDRFGTPDMDLWGDYSVFSKTKLQQLLNENSEEVDYVRFVQFHLDRQLREVYEYARSRGVAIKGDIPIGISRCSVDAWMYPELFNLDCTAGAPPDDFAVLGQNWGFPTYRWDVMARDGYRWWRQRLGKMSVYFSAYRIDHLLGFFRIWQIPADTLHGLLGVFCPALPYSKEELSETGFRFKTPLHTHPYITDGVIDKVFGNDSAMVKNTYLTKHGDTYALRPEFGSQIAIARYFENHGMTQSHKHICNGLMDLMDDVLFIEDPYKPEHFHPRISASSTAIYASLSDDQRQRFDSLYEEFYFHRHNSFWEEKAMEKLPALIDATGMLACAEDLGMIPACVPHVMERLKILSLEIQRMPKEFGLPFGVPSHYPYLSVCSTSTHDMPGIRQWWAEDYERASRFYHEMLSGEGEAPRQATAEICRGIVAMNLNAPSMLCIIPLQDWLAMDGTLRRDNPCDEQINVPANPRHYWRYRMHITTERLLEATEFNTMIREIIAESHRGCARKHG